MSYRYGRSYKQAWMATFQEQLATALPQAQGVIRWGDAEHLYNLHLAPAEAVAAYCATYRKELEQKL